MGAEIKTIEWELQDLEGRITGKDFLHTHFPSGQWYLVQIGEGYMEGWGQTRKEESPSAASFENGSAVNSPDEIIKTYDSMKIQDRRQIISPPAICEAWDEKTVRGIFMAYLYRIAVVSLFDRISSVPLTPEEEKKCDEEISKTTLQLIGYGRIGYPLGWKMDLEDAFQEGKSLRAERARSVYSEVRDTALDFAKMGADIDDFVLPLKEQASYIAQNNKDAIDSEDYVGFLEELDSILLQPQWRRRWAYNVKQFITIDIPQRGIVRWIERCIEYFHQQKDKMA